jgi:preprotein translocase subunit YajC
MNFYILIPFSLFILLLLIYLIRKNQKDKAKFEKFLNNDFSKRVETEEVDD